jgi:thioredoxin-dependent peroxiredoxin
MQGAKINYPILADRDLEVSKLYKHAAGREALDVRRANDRNQPDGALRLRRRPRPENKADADLSDDDGPQLRRDSARARFDAAKHTVATPANWKQGDDVIIAGSVSDDEAKTLFPAGWRAPKPYMRIVKQPG